jgi:PAS domain S-box-containing protein
VIRISSVIATIWLCLILVKEPGLLRVATGWMFLAVVGMFWVASASGFSERTRFVIVEIAYFNASLAAIMVNATAPGIPVLLTLFVLLATICYGRTGGIAAGAACIALALFGAWGWTTGFMPIGEGLRTPVPTHFDFWARVILAQAIAICGVVGIVSYVLSEMRGMLFQRDLAEEKFSKVFRICPDAMVIADLETGRLIEVNQSHELLTGYRRDEALGRTLGDLGMFEDPGEFERLSERLRATGSIHRVERRIRDRAGLILDISYNAEVFDSAGRKCALLTMRDVTENKRAEAALVANENRFRSFIENASVGFYRSTPDGQIVMANRALIGLMGYDSFEELAARNLEHEGYEPGYSRKTFKERIEAVGYLSGWETAWKRRDGSTIYVRESANVTRGSDGAILYYDGIIEDISERKRAEQALRESEERYRNLADAAFEGVFITENGRVIDVNDQGLKLLGFERSEVIGREVTDFVSPEARQLVADNIREQRELVYQHRMLRKDGSSFEAEAQAKMMHTAGRRLRMTAVRDITERLQNERRQRNLEEQLRQTQKLEALGTLAGGIAHDFNNILTAILGNLQLTEMDLAAGHPARETLESSVQACRRARDLVARILSFSRLEQDNRAPAQLGPTVLEAVQLLRVGMPANIEARTVVDDACPLVVFDPSQMHQVVMNLGTNGIHAMQERGGLLEFELAPVTPGDGFRERHPQVSADHAIRLSVRDSGCGMGPSVLNRVFEPFYTTKANDKGTGLGLAMVHAIVKSHHGAIVVESTPGKGTLFELYFPAASLPACPAQSPVDAARSRALEPFGRGRKVMLVDDQASVLKVGAAVLKRLGFVPVTYEDPVAAVAAFGAGPAGICAVISDLTMPNMTGLELAERINAAQPGTPVIIASGYLPSETKQRAKALGIRSVVSKPYELHELASKLGQILGARPPEGAGAA